MSTRVIFSGFTERLTERFASGTANDHAQSFLSAPAASPENARGKDSNAFGRATASSYVDDPELFNREPER